MYIATVPNRRSPPAILLREGYRDGGKVKNRTLANLSHWPPAKVDLLRRVLRDEPLTPSTTLFEVLASRHHGHVQAVRTAMHHLGVDTLIASRPSRERDLVVAMVAARILEPDSKLATTRWWHTTTLPTALGVRDADEDALYEAMDWLLARQARIEQKLAARHLRAGGLVLYDLTSSYFEGTTCPLAAFGHNRDGKKGKLQVNYGLLTDGRGCPVAVSVFPGNTGDPPTLLPAVQQVRERFGIETLVIVGDRGMISQTQITALQSLEGVDWITALKTGAIRALMADGHLQLGLFDERNLFELTHPDFPGERLGAADAVRHYKQLSDVERAFRALKTIDLKVRPIRHRLEARVRAHIFLCLLAYYVEWHMREVWRPLLFGDEDQAAKRTRDPVAPAKRSPAALRQVHTKVLDDGTPVHSFPTLLKELSSIVRNVCRPRSAGAEAPTFELTTTPTPTQQRAYELLKTITV